jgi:energy-coupling factor transport system ATP-binding protein
MAIITIRDLNFGYDKKDVFNHFDLTIETGKWVTIVGPNGSGKSTLVKLLVGLLKTESYINIAGLLMSPTTLEDIRMNVGVVFENPDDQFIGETVADDLAFSLENLGYSKIVIKEKINEMSELFELKPILNKQPHQLSGGEKQIVALASALIMNPKILMLDEAFTMVENELIDKIFKLIKEIRRRNNLTIINITHDMEQSLYGDDIIVLNGGKIFLSGPKEEVFKQEKELTKLGIELPFMASLSLKLKFYGLVDEMIFDMDEMVDKLWK